MFYSIILDNNGNSTGIHSYVEQPQSYPTNEFPCTEEQSKTPTQYQVINGVLTPNLAAIQQAQSELLEKGYLHSIQNCTVSINSVNYTIDLSQVNLLLNQLSAFTAQQSVTANTTTFNRYIKLTNGTYTSFTAAQVVQAITQIESYLHNQKEILIWLLDKVNSATTPEAVQAIVWG